MSTTMYLRLPDDIAREIRKVSEVLGLPMNETIGVILSVGLGIKQSEDVLRVEAARMFAS